MQFVEAAVRTGHPKSFLKTLPCELVGAFNATANWSAADIAAYRVQQVKSCLSRANELEQQERILHEGMSLRAKSCEASVLTS